MNITDEQACIIGKAIFSSSLDQSFAISGKKEFQINLLAAIIQAGLLDLHTNISTEIALQLGMDPRQLERLVYATYLNNPAFQSNGLTITEEEIVKWNVTTQKDAKNEEIRFEVPSQIARVKLEQYFIQKGIQPESGRSNYIILVRIDRIAAVLKSDIGIYDDALKEISKNYEADITESLLNAATPKEKLLVALKSGSAFVIQTVVGALISKAIGA